MRETGAPVPYNAGPRAVGVVVVVVNWNGGRIIDACLQALVQQTVRPERIIVVDNGSQDGSPDRIAARFSDVELIKLGRNTGFAVANNRAAEHIGQAQWLALINPDTVAKPDWLERILAAAAAETDCACFGSRLIADTEGTVLDGVGDVYHTSGLHWREGHLTPGPGRHLAPREIFAPCAAAALYRLDAFREVGGFDESFFCYAEDIDLGFRLRLRGYECLYVPDAVVYHMGSAISGRDSDFTIYHGHRNLVWVYVKNMPWPLFWLYLPQHLAVNVWLIVRFAQIGRGRVILKAKWDALRGLSGLWRKRREIQRCRRVSFWALRRSMAKGLRPLLLRRQERMTVKGDIALRSKSS